MQRLKDKIIKSQEVEKSRVWNPLEAFNAVVDVLSFGVFFLKKTKYGVVACVYT